MNTCYIAASTKNYPDGDRCGRGRGMIRNILGTMAML